MAESRLLTRLGLHRPELRAWAMYDWANSVFWATVIQILPAITRPPGSKVPQPSRG